MSARVLQRQMVPLALQGSSESLLRFKNSRTQAEKKLSPSLKCTCAAPRAGAWSRIDPMLCSPYERQVLIEASAL